ncbi:acyloxyacyl hydrolase [Rhodobacteraceae bacterium CCMM004]|nr:acyloxyacyl hydrolase [Rhodobacteraceae bacterium CCMM004]
MIRTTVLALALAGATSSATAQELVFGGGIVDFHSNAGQAAIVEVEYRFAPFTRLGPFDVAFGVAGAVHDTGDLWVGAGLVNTARLGGAWFLESSVMPGYYDAGRANTDLGHAFEFRSQIAVGYDLTPTSSLSLAFQHKSNAGLGDINPGLNALTLRLHRKF